ncbi:MAG: OmpA family protein [Lentisphaeraceae bacterium]|nr:OmpA family protein [Lentisphaeraceae bacterium]
MLKLVSSILMIITLFVFTGCESKQRVYNPHAKFGGNGEPGFEAPITGPEIGGPNTGLIEIGNPNGDIIPGNIGQGTPVDHPFKSSPVYFAYDSAVVGQAYDSLLKQVADYINANPTYHLTISGHCDERGSEEYNRALGERRALSVKQAIIAFGAPDGRINTVSFGEDKPAMTGSSLEAFAKNRRAEFEVFAK